MDEKQSLYKFTIMFIYILSNWDVTFVERETRELIDE